MVILMFTTRRRSPLLLFLQVADVPFLAALQNLLWMSTTTYG